MLADIFQIALVASPFAGIVGIKYLDKYLDRAERKRNEPIVVDGRDQQEWYEIVKAIGKEAYEELSLGPLDGLERNEDMAWDARRLMGVRLWRKLEEEWYPERFGPVFPGRDGRYEEDGIVFTFHIRSSYSICDVVIAKAMRNNIVVKTEILAESFNDVWSAPGIGKDHLIATLRDAEKKDEMDRQRRLRQKAIIEARKDEFDMEAMIKKQLRDAEKAIEVARRARPYTQYNSKKTLYYNGEYNKYYYLD